jgi:hypothetical protein
VEPDQHPGPEQGTGRTPDPGAGRSHEQPETPEAAPSGGEAEGAVTQPAAPEPDPSPSTDVIMSKLPRTRPHRATGRRHREQARQARQAPRPSAEAPGVPQEASPTPRGAKRSTPQRSTAARPKSRATTAPSARPARRRPTAAVPVTQAPTPRDPGRPRAETGKAPGLPRLAVDGAVEAVKLPLRVGGRLTLRALDAAARSLRGR